MSRSNDAAVISLDDYRRRREADRRHPELQTTSALSDAMPAKVPAVAWVPVVWTVGWWMPAGIAGRPA